MQNKLYFFLPDVNGGVASIINNLISFNDPAFSITVIAYTDIRYKKPAANFNNAVAVQIKKIHFNSHDNLFSTVKKFRNAINDTHLATYKMHKPGYGVVFFSIFTSGVGK